MSNETISEKLDKLEAEILEAKEEKAKLDGMLTSLLQQMEERFGVTSVKDARELLNEIRDKIKKNDKILNKKFEILKEEYEW